MKYFYIWIIFALIFISCEFEDYNYNTSPEIIEEVFLNKDGSIEYYLFRNIVVDELDRLTDYYENFLSDTGIALTFPTVREAREGYVDSVWNKYLSYKDTLIETDLIKLYNENVFVTKEERKIGSNSNYFVDGNRSDGYLKVGVYSCLENERELNLFMELLKNICFIELNGKKEVLTEENIKISVDYDSKKRNFSRNSSIKGSELNFSRENFMFTRYTKVFLSSKLTTIIHTPRKIKNVNGEGLTELNERKVVFKYYGNKLNRYSLTFDFEILM